MALGTVIRPGGSLPQPVALPNRVGPREAMVAGLAAFLEGVEFRVDGGDARDEVFNLSAVMRHWPGDAAIDYPAASIVEMAPTEYQEHSLTPTPLEETWGTFDAMIGLRPVPAPDGKTVLWKEGEASTGFQVDFWCELEADRQAIEAALPAAFNPYPDAAAGVTVEGPELYYGRPLRFTLETAKHDDSLVTAGRGEFRLRCVVRAECDIVSLRMATATATPAIEVELIDPNDPGEEE